MAKKVNVTCGEITLATNRIATAGEVFDDGSVIDLIQDRTSGRVGLLLASGAGETTGTVVTHLGRSYEPVTIHASILRDLSLPTRSTDHGSTRELFLAICKLVAEFVALPEKFISIAGRFVMASWLPETMRLAPALEITGPDKSKASQFVQLLHCLCRHALSMGAVTPAAFCSLPSGVTFTFLVTQQTISVNLQSLLDHASMRDERILRRGVMLDLHGAQVLNCQSIPAGEAWSHRSIQVPMVLGDRQPPALNPEIQRRVAAEFQSRLLSFRHANLHKAGAVIFDAQRFSYPLRELARSLAAATPDEPELQADLFSLLRDADAEIRSEKWIDEGSVVNESVRVAYYELPGGSVYVGELAKIAREIWTRRGEAAEIDSGPCGKVLKDLGYETEKRDARGVRLVLSEAVGLRAKRLASEFGLADTTSDSATPTGEFRTAVENNT